MRTERCSSCGEGSDALAERKHIGPAVRGERAASGIDNGEAARATEGQRRRGTSAYRTMPMLTGRCWTAGAAILVRGTPNRRRVFRARGLDSPRANDTRARMVYGAHE